MSHVMLNTLRHDDVFIGEVPDIRFKDRVMKVWYRESDHSVVYRCGEGFPGYMTHGQMCQPRCGVGMRKLICKHLGIKDDQFAAIDTNRPRPESFEVQGVFGTEGDESSRGETES